MFDTEKIKSFPENPGCYLMKDISGKIIMDKIKEQR